LDFNIGADDVIGEVGEVPDRDIISEGGADEFSTFADGDVVADDTVGEFGVVVYFGVIADLDVSFAFCGGSDGDVITYDSVVGFSSFGEDLE